MQKFWDRVTTLLGSPSVVDLATMLNVKRSTLSSWIHNDRRPPMDVLLNLTAQTGLSLENLEYGLDWEPSDDEEAAENHSPKFKAIMQMVSGLNSEEQDIIYKLLTYMKHKG
ncbi:MAG TPA: helix-turn-helix transcriptional regulator [Sphaerochaeta sp.]|nr:helix-turn-helix transcriptional regulator [Sphaerochaeta sp.]